MVKVIGVTEAAIHEIRKKIITGEFKPGQKLGESELAEQLDISRPPLREAFRTLQQEGLLVTIPRKGMSVVDISLRDLKNIYQFREMAELFAIENFNKNDLDKLETSLTETKSLNCGPGEMDTSSLWNFRKIIINFHVKLIETLNNDRVSRFYACTISSLNRYHFMQFYCDGVNHSVDDHQKIYELLKKDNIIQAKRFMKEHLKWSFQTLSKIVSQKIK